ncbi:hypothetical protein V5O48_007109 [Marasmius crinis-equi]|uniref:Uncharacterized protein n=1 Tax=Marasmius crinis-equi TaxID=585013 RepID=A0ABR3FHP4_9AGAR
MLHLIRNCNGEHRCLDGFACQVTTLNPASTLSIARFETLDEEHRGLLHIAARVCPDICDTRQCPDTEGRTHSMKLVVEDGIVKVLNDDLASCSCGDVLYTIPDDLSACVLSGWNKWLPLHRRWERMMESILSSSPNDRYTSPSPEPELPTLDRLFDSSPHTVSKKRPAEDSKDESDSDSSPCSTPPLPPAKRMRTGPGKGELLSGSVLRKFH